METKLRFYNTAAWQSKKRCRVLPSGNPEKVKDDMIQIKFTLHKLKVLREVGGEDRYPTKISCPQQVPTFVADKLVPMVSRGKLLKHREAYAKRYGTAVLSALFGVPESEQVSITDTVFKVVETALPLRRICVSIVEVTHQIRPVTGTSVKFEITIDTPHHEANDATIADAAASTSTDGAGASESSQLIDGSIRENPTVAVKLERPQRSAKNPGYLKDYCFRNKVGHCSFYC